MDTLIKRVGHYVDMGAASFQDLVRLPHRIETRRADQEIVVAGETVDFVFIIESGWAIRFSMLDDGRRQILNFMLPGDCFDMMSLNKAQSDHNISAATDVVLRRINADAFLDVIMKKQQLASAFWWTAIQEEAILREQIVRNGRRTARESVGHIILELNRRVAAVSGTLDNYLYLPVPQTLLADALGLSVVHISRTLSGLRDDGLLRTTNRGIEILDRDRLAAMSDFDSRYLHLKKMSFTQL